MAFLSDIRSGERATALAATTTIAAIMAAHELLETARDAIFLSSLPAARLPWVYLAIAAVGLVISLLRSRRGLPLGRLSVSIYIAALATLLFWLPLRDHEIWTAYALYIFTGIFATVVVTQFWILTGSLYTATQAKRVFGFIGIGSILGAMAGAVLARGLIEVVAVEHLVVAAAALLVIAARSARTLEREAGASAASTSISEPLGVALRTVANDAFARRIGLALLTSTATFTLLDYVFKSVVAAQVDAAELSSFFASVNIALNLGSLLVQVFLVRWLLTRFGVSWAAAFLPVVLFGGAIGVALSGGLVAALMLKGGDGCLRHSLHRTVSEVLFVPLPSAVRTAAKTFFDVIGQRSAQALTSLGLLAATALATPDARQLAVVVAALALSWLVIALGIHRRYLALFRATLEGQSVETRVDFPALDMGSLESLLRGLNSANDDEVLAALKLMDKSGRLELVPDLILLHPSRAVVMHALELFAEERRRSFLAVATRLSEHGDPEVRAAALRARLLVDRDESTLRSALTSPVAAVRATALVEMAARSHSPADEVVAIFTSILESTDRDAQVALARAIRNRPAASLVPVLAALGRAPHTEVRHQAALAIGQMPDPSLFPLLLDMLGDRDLREPARTALLAGGPAGLTMLDEALRNTALAPAIRQHIPRTISRFPAAAAAPLMLAELERESDEVVRFKLLRGLGSLRARNPHLEFDRELLDAAIGNAVRRAFRTLDWRLTVAAGIALAPPAPDLERTPQPPSSSKDGHRATPAGELLLSLLHDQEAAALERITRLLGLRYPNEDFEGIHRGLRSTDPRARSSSSELLASLLPAPLRSAVLALGDDRPDADRLAGASLIYRAEPRDYNGVLADMLGRATDTIRCTAAHHAAELREPELDRHIAALSTSPSAFVREVSSRAGQAELRPEGGACA